MTTKLDSPPSVLPEFERPDEASESLPQNILDAQNKRDDSDANAALPVLKQDYIERRMDLSIDNRHSVEDAEQRACTDDEARDGSASVAQVDAVAAGSSATDDDTKGVCYP